MKKQRAEVKILRIGKETLLPLRSCKMNEVAGGAGRTAFIHNIHTVVFHF